MTGRNKFTVLVAGDLVISRPYNTSGIDSKVLSLFESSDLNVVNLEAAVTQSSSMILKTGPHLKADKKSTRDILKALSIDVVTLANNHILDYDQQGVEETLSFCSDSQIKTVGAGMSLQEAQRIFYTTVSTTRLAIVNFSENEWSSAKRNSAGSNPMDTIENIRQLQEAKLHADFTLVIVHGGNEYYPLPNPKLQDQFRFYAEHGADVVIGHHTHCVSGSEIYNGVPIFYSLGNFLFTQSSDYPEWYIGGCLEINFDEGKLACRFHLLKQSEHDFGLTLLEGAEKDAVSARIDEYNEIISDASKLNSAWEKFADQRSSEYLNLWSPMSFIGSRYLKAVLKKMGIKSHNRKGISLLLNLMRCESHRELSKEILENYLKK